MSNTKGEGRSEGEKGFRVIEPLETRRERRRRRREEEEEWAARCGPVTVRRRDEEKNDG